MTSEHEPLLRKLTVNDIPAALDLSTEAGWNQTGDDWRLLLDLSPEGCIVLDLSGEIVATATVVTYGNRLAWIGMVLTREAYRGRGFAKRLMNEALRIADTFGVESVKLDATDQGKPIYEKLGFRVEEPVERWQCANLVANPVTSPTVVFTPTLFSIDESTFGANRSTLLQLLAKSNSPVVLNSSYALTRTGRVSGYLGPCIASSGEAARRVISSALARHSGQSCYWDLLPSNIMAVDLARELGFIPRRHLTRMVRGRDLRAQSSQIHALAGFEFG